MLKIIPVVDIDNNDKVILEELFDCNTDLETFGIYSLGYDWDDYTQNFIITFNNQIVGQCGFGRYVYEDPSETDDGDTENTCSTYIWLDKYYRGMGLGHQAGELLTEYIFNNHSFYTTIRKVAFSYNKVSMNNIKKQGFKFEKESGDYCFFNLTKDEYKELKNGCLV